MGRRLVRLGAACAATAALFAAGGWLGADAEAARPGKAARGWGALGDGDRGGAREVQVGDALWVNGQPMELSVLFTSDRPEKVIAWYREALGRKGLQPYAHVEDRVGHVSVFDPDDGLQHFVTALPQRSGQTLVLLGAADPRRPPRLLGGAGAAPFPVPAEERGFLWYASDDAGTRAQNAQFVCALPEAAVLAFYRRELAAQGYVEQVGEAGRALLVFRKPGASLSVAVQSLGGAPAQGSLRGEAGTSARDARTGTAVFVSRVEGGVR